MVFSAVYLDHHWIIDVLLGLTYASAFHMLFRVVFANLRVPHSTGTRDSIAPSPPLASPLPQTPGSPGG
jgi:membrane-associated phospholipid phosphatase